MSRNFTSRPPFFNSIKLCALLCALFLSYLPCANAAEIIRYTGAKANVEARQDYFISLLVLALKNTGKDYQLQQTEIHYEQAGAIREMIAPKGNIDLIWTMTSDEREATLIPVRIPIDKGLIGWRVAFVKKGNANLFESVKSIKDLQKFKAGQDQFWPDTEILKNNGLPVVTTTSYESLFNMLVGERFDYFPRSVQEIGGEFQIQGKIGIEIETKVALHYPAAFYFFVSPRHPQLAKDLREGLEKAIADGSFEKLFDRFQAPLLESLDLKNRTVIELKNPLLRKSKLPLQRTELWYHPH